MYAPLGPLQSCHVTNCRCGVDLAVGAVVLGGDGGVQHDGALPLPPLRVGQDATAQVHRRLSRKGLCPAGSLSKHYIIID